MTRSSGRAGESAWIAQSIRATFFHTKNAADAGEGWWESLTGESPESTVNKPKSAERIEIGPWNGAQLVLHVQSGRTDWVLNWDIDPEMGVPPLPDCLALLLGLVNKWLPRTDTPDMTRMAFGGNALLDVKDVEEGYRTLCHYLPFKVDRATSSDFLYQINRRRKSKTVSGLEINRLMKWSIATLKRSSLSVVDGGLATTSEPQVVRTSCQVDLDINTAPRASPTIPRESWANLFTELVDLGREIVREGDIS